MKKTLLAAALAMLLSGSCVGEMERMAPDGEGSVMLEVKAGGSSRSRGFLSADESRIADLNVYVYKDGMLAGWKYCEGESVTVELSRGVDYRLYALANVGGFRPAELEKDLPSSVFSVKNVSDLNTGALPMVCSEAIDVRLDSDKGSVVFEMQRLVSRLVFSVEKELSNCGYEIESVRLRQASADVHPFATGSSAGSTIDGDYATEEELAGLNAGGSVSFYMLENCMGDLLKGNADPMKKIPENIPGKGEKCTYLEVSGSWTTSGAASRLVYRMYLGKNNCSNFDVERNTSMRLQLCAEDSNTLGNSWKIEAEEVFDHRVLAFAADTVELRSGFVVSSDLTVWPQDLKYAVLWDRSGASVRTGFQCAQYGDKLNMTASYSGANPEYVTLTARSWDGKVSDEMTVRVVWDPDEFSDYQLTLPEYCLQSGRLCLPLASASSPVSVSVGSKTWKVGQASSKKVDYYSDSSGFDFWLLPASNTIYFRAARIFSVKSTQIELSTGTSNRTISVPAPKYPSYYFSRTTVPVNEHGMENYEEDLGIHYDCRVSVGLSGDDGNLLDLKTFAVPDELLSARSLPLTDSRRYDDLIEMCSGDLEFNYFDPSSAAGSSASEYIGLDSEFNCSMCGAKNAVGELFFWGKKVADGKTVKVGVEMKNLYYDDGTMDADRITASVAPAFPDQRYLGTFRNCRIAPSGRRSDRTALDLSAGGVYGSPARIASWSIRHCIFDIPGDFESAFSVGVSDAYSNGCRYTGGSLVFAEPSVSTFPSCGAMVLRGSVTNPHTGRVISGYYAFDLVLDMTVGAQVDFYDPENAGIGAFSFCFVPFCEYASHSWADLWNDCFIPGIRVRSAMDGDSYLMVSGSAADNPYSLFGSYPSTGENYSAACFALQSAAPHFYFDFLGDGVSMHSLNLTRSAMSLSPEFSQYSKGQFGYYDIRRQCDEDGSGRYPGSTGLENLCVEAALGSFVNY